MSDGAGQVYLINVDKASAKWTGSIESTLELVGEEGGELVPFRMHSVDLAHGGLVLALVSIAVKVPQAPLPKFPGAGGARAKLPSTTEFDYLCVDLSSRAGSSAMLVRWKVRSHDLPAFVTFLPESSTYLIGAPSTPLLDTAAVPSSVPAPSIATTATSPSPPTPSPTPSGPKPAPFSWTQDKDSLTVAFAVPSDTPTSSIRITFSRQFLSLLVGSASSLLSNATPPTPVPRVSHKKFWDAIDPHSSVWTFDREAEGRDSTFGVLSLHLEKMNAGTKWPDLFADTHGDEAVEGERELEGVAETVDPSALAQISESMEQWTQGAGGGVGASDEGIGQGVPTSLTGEEMDVEVDGDAGRQCVVTWLSNVAGQPPKIIRPHPSFYSSLLCIPLPISPPNSDSSVVIKNDVDGLAFAPPLSPSSGWTHTTTFPALAFVLATKRDASFVYHLGHSAVFAFDSPSSPTLVKPGQGIASSGNLFVYFQPESIRSMTGKQMVLRIGGPASGSLLGVGAVALAGQAPFVLALCENELVVYRIL